MLERTILNDYPSKSKKALEALLDFVGKINKSDSIVDGIWYLTQYTIQSLGFEDCVVYLVDEKGEYLVQTAAFGIKNPTEKRILNPIRLKYTQGIVGIAASNCKSYLVNDTSKVTEYIVDVKKRYSELAVPIHYHNKLYGVIDSEHSQTGFFTELHQRYLEILACVLASKITSNLNIKKLEESYLSLQQEKNHSDTLLLISELTYNSNTIEDFYLGLHQIISKQVNAHSFFVVLYNTENEKYTCPYFYDEYNDVGSSNSFDEKHIPKKMIKDVIKEQKSKFLNFKVNNYETEMKESGKLNSNVTSWLAVPFQINNSLQGAIELQSFDSEIRFNQRDKEFLTFMGQHISTAIEQKLKDQKLQYQALHDSVTGLANRSLFLDRLEHAFSRASRLPSTEMAVLYIDFDDFKSINDNHGHQAGDDVLRVAAHRIKAQLRASDTIARLGGDEYAILLDEVNNQSTVFSISQRIIQAMKKPIHSGRDTIISTISIGIAFKDGKVTCFEDLLKNSDHAMYFAKRNGKNRIQLYEQSLHQTVLSERILIQELKVAINENQLFFHYQPIIDLKLNTIVGFEALVRWNHPKRGLITPDTFIQVAEQHDLMNAIDSQLLTSVAEQLCQWKTITSIPFYININISSKRFVDTKLIKEIHEVINKYNLPKYSIGIELTEHVLMKNIDRAKPLFQKLKELGVKISLDDFGTGYSSLSYINHLPFDVIKIDRSFVAQLHGGNKENPIISIIISLAKTLNIEIVAEGIETIEQLEVLKNMNCSFGQGYYFSKPVSSCQTIEVIKNMQLNETIKVVNQ